MTTLPIWFAAFASDTAVGDESDHPRAGRHSTTDGTASSVASSARTSAFELPADFAARIREGDEQALDLLFQRAFIPLTRFAYGFVGSSDIAEDVVQDVFVRLWHQGKAWQPKTTVIAYLYGAVRNQALNAVRSDAARARLRSRVGTVSSTGESIAGMPSHVPAADHDVHDATIYLHFDRALASLTERQRTAVLLRYEQGRTVPEVADILRIAQRAAEKLLSRAVRELREQLEPLVK
jgi:RNA polymerase sigma-70 factor (ECF subfamily)